ncbi:MAG: hypothetical protein OWQ56_06455 [Acidithiobacillus caldus]|nr:hypothetical protein [Acidithiobacillus caldus]
MLRAMAAYRRILALLLIVLLGLQPLLLEAQERGDWVNFQFNGKTDPRMFAYLPPQDDLLHPVGDGQVCAAPINRRALAAEQDLDCTRRSLRELSPEQRAALAAKLYYRTHEVVTRPTFWAGVADGARGELEDIYHFFRHLRSNLSQLREALGYLREHPEAILPLLKSALEGADNTVLAYVCEPSAANARA